MPLVEPDDETIHRRMAAAQEAGQRERPGDATDSEAPPLIDSSSDEMGEAGEDDEDDDDGRPAEKYRRTQGPEVVFEPVRAAQAAAEHVHPRADADLPAPDPAAAPLRAPMPLHCPGAEEPSRDAERVPATGAREIYSKHPASRTCSLRALHSVRHLAPPQASQRRLPGVQSRKNALAGKMRLAETCVYRKYAFTLEIP